MEQTSLTTATWIWLIGPQALVVILSLLNFFRERGDG